MFHRTSKNMLIDMCHKLGINRVTICRLDELSKYMKIKSNNNFIINLDNYGSGTHWVACNKVHKIYFDSYAGEIPEELKKLNYKKASKNKELQTFTAEDCGPLCVLWLYYINYETNDKYYKLFEDIYA